MPAPSRTSASRPAVRVRDAAVPAELPLVRTLFREYADSLGFALDFQGFEQELAALPGEFAPPHGALLLVEVDGEVVGCVALRPLEPGACEMKRMYVRPAARGRGAGRALGIAIVERGRALGYRAMRLDTIDTMHEAIALYRTLGFDTIPPYRFNPIPGALYFEASLDPEGNPGHRSRR